MNNLTMGWSKVIQGFHQTSWVADDTREMPPGANGAAGMRRAGFWVAAVAVVSRDGLLEAAAKMAKG